MNSGVKKKRPTRDPILLEVAAAIGAGRISMRQIRDESEFVHGYTEPNGAIVVNPVVLTVDALVHECLHRLRPSWSEATVRRRTTRLLKQMSYSEIDKMYELLMVQTQRRVGTLLVER